MTIRVLQVNHEPGEKALTILTLGTRNTCMTRFVKCMPDQFNIKVFLSFKMNCSCTVYYDKSISPMWKYDSDAQR